MKWILATLGMLFSFYAAANVEQYVRYRYMDDIQYGQLIGDVVYPLVGNIYKEFSVSKNGLELEKVELLIPTEPEKVFAVGMNFASHMSSPSDKPPPLFLKLPSSLIASGKTIKAPRNATNVHFEGELVVVIGKVSKNIGESDAKSAVFGVLVGNDLTERNWQASDLQWMRSKASDGFGPVSGVITRGIDYENLLLTTRLNGQIVQQENTKFMIHSVSKVVSYLSHYFTLKPGDLIYMGTPGRTKALSDQDVVSVTIDGVGTVENQIQF